MRETAYYLRPSVQLIEILRLISSVVTKLGRFKTGVALYDYVVPGPIYVIRSDYFIEFGMGTCQRDSPVGMSRGCIQDVGDLTVPPEIYSGRFW